jgi:hypothetical protein
MPVVPETVVVAGRVGSSPEGGGGGAWGDCAIAVVERASAALNTLIPNSRLIRVLSDALDGTAHANRMHILKLRGCNLHASHPPTMPW